MRGIDHDCYCISLTRTSLEFFSRTKTDGSRSSQSKKGNEIQVSLRSLLTHCSKLMQTCTHSCKNTRLQVFFPYYFELAPFKTINSSYQQERMSSFSLAISSISEQCILPFFYRRLDRLCLSLQYLNCDQVYFHGARKLGKKRRPYHRLYFTSCPSTLRRKKF